MTDEYRTKRVTVTLRRSITHIEETQVTFNILALASDETCVALASDLAVIKEHTWENLGQISDVWHDQFGNGEHDPKVNILGTVE